MTMKKEVIFCISVGRSDYDRYFPIINELNNRKNIKLYIVTTKSHQNPIFGKTLSYIDPQFKVLKKKYSNFREKDDLIKTFSEDINFLNTLIKKYNPDKIIVLGDRFEMLIGPIAAIPYNLPVIHLFGGSVTLGAIDELVRHAITKMSHIHYPLLDTYKKRIIQMGEEKWRVKSIGMHELKDLEKIKDNKTLISNKFNFKLPFMLITYHSVTLELKKLNYQLNELKKAIKKININAVITYPNADKKNKVIIDFIKKNFSDKKKYLILKNSGKKIYTFLLKNCEFLLGNTSSGIVEAATFKKIAINIGTRQDGKYKPKNVIDAKYNYQSILNAVRKAMKVKDYFKKKKFRNPYDPKIKINNLVDLILKINKTDKVLRKKFMNL